MLRTRRVWLAGAIALLAGAASAQTFVRKIPDLPALAGAVDVAVDAAGDYWVACSYGQLIKLSPTGQELQRIGGQFRSGSGPTWLYNTYSVAAGATDELYVAASPYIVRFDLDGQVVGWFGGSGTANGKFQQNVGKIATAPNGDILVVDIGNHRVQRFDNQGNFLQAFGTAGTGPGQFDFRDETLASPGYVSSTGIATDASGNIYVVDRGNNRIQKFDPTGAFQSLVAAGFTSSTFYYTHNDLVVDGQGRLILGGQGSTVLRVFPAWGQAPQSIPNPVPGGVSAVASGLGVDGQGNVCLADSQGRILNLSSSFGVSGTLGNGPSALQDGLFYNPRGVVFDASGAILVADNTSRLQRFDTSGGFLGKVNLASGPSSSFSFGPIAQDSSGFLYNMAYSAGANRIQKLTAAGAWVEDAVVLGSTYPRCIALDASGAILIGADDGVRKFDPSGALEISIPGFAAFGLAVDSAGRIIAADRNGGAVRIFDAGGTALSSISVYSPWSVVVDDNDRIIVGSQDTITVFSTTGTRLVEFGTSGGGDGQFIGVGSMAFREGVLAVSEGFNNRIQLIDLTQLDQQVPVVTIVSPPTTNTADGAVISTNTFPLTADVVDASASTVTSTPTGLFALLPAGGGTASTAMNWPYAYDTSYVISVNARDTSGNTGGTTVRVTRDTAPPTLSCSLVDGIAVGTDTITFNVSVYDLTSKTLTVSHGGGAYSQAGTGTPGYLSRSVTVTLQSGTNVIEMVATDAAGHTTTLTRTVTADLAAPLVELLGLGGPQDPDCFGPGQSPLPVSVRVTDVSSTTVSSVPAGVVSGSLPAGGGTRTGSWSLSQGLNTMTVSARDAYNRTGSAAVTVLYDLTPPSVSFDAPTAGQLARGTVHVAVDAVDLFANGDPGCGVASVAIAIDGTLVDTLPNDGSGTYELDFDTAGLSDGSHTFTATATDGVGNSGSASIAFTLDNTPPQVAITAPLANAFVSGNDLPFIASASDASGIVVVQMNVAGAAPNDTDGSTTWATPVAIASVASVYDTLALPDGSLLLRVTARDAAGNEATAEVTVTVDNTAPERALVSPLDGATVTGVVPIVANASDTNLVSLVILVDGDVVGSTSSSSLTVPFDTTARGEGPMVVEVVVTDAAGNVSRSAATVRVVNLIYDFDPDTLSLKNKGQGVVTAHIEGPTVANLLPVASHRIELRVNGGNSVSALSAGGVGDADGDGVPDLTVRFDRSTLISSVRAGVLGGFLPSDGLVDIELWVDGARVGASQVRVKS